MDFLMDEKYPDNPIRTVKLNVQENGDVFYNNLIFKYIEMPKFNKAENALVSTLDKWLYALKNMTLFKEIPLILRGDAIFEKLFEVARFANLNQEDMTAYMKAKLDRMDYDRGLQVSKDEGRLEGEKRGESRGIQKGRTEEKISLIKNLLIKGKLSISEIAEAAEVSLDFVMSVRKQLSM